MVIVLKKLNELYNTDSDVLIKGIKTNSQDIEKGDLFVCTMGVTADRHDFIEDALKNGASAIIVSQDVNYQIPTVKVKNTNEELNSLLIKFYDDPFKDLILIGVTGTDGKTTLATIIQTLIGKDNCMYIGTNGVSYKDINLSTKNTTPALEDIYKYADIAKKAQLGYIVMETSSEAFFYQRLKGLFFDASLITNITRDHLNVHKTLNNYIECKGMLFKQTKKSGLSILNRQDKYYARISKACQAKVYSYGRKSADIKLLDYRNNNQGTLIKFKIDGKIYNIVSPLIGYFNIYNLLAGILLCLKLKIDINHIINNIKDIYIMGRLEDLKYGQNYKIILDYAHTPDALLKVLKYFKKQKQANIITVTGSAGGREKEKRALMGKVVLKYSDLVIFTMDDPRYEDPQIIINEMISKSRQKNYEIIIDRREAINRSLSIAKENDIVFIAGKGRDNYMAIKDQYLPYCDYDVIKDYFEKKK